MTDDKPVDSDQAEFERWRDHYRHAGERDADFQTLSGESLEPLYTPESVRQLDYLRDLGYPGHFPMTRGVYHTMYRGRLWTMRQFAGFGSPEETNARYKFLLKQGQGGLSVAFDMPTLMGRDSDDPRSEGEVGRCGVATDSLADFETLFEGIPMGDISTSMTISGPATILFAFFLAAAERQGVPWAQLDGTLQTDILKEYIAQKEWIFPPRPHLRLIGDLIEFCATQVPKFHPISVSGYHIREAGSTAQQELAFTLADGFSYVELGQQRGLDVDHFAQGLSFFFNAHIDFFEEIAKYRAARRIWARWLREAGSTAQQELAFTLADGFSYVELGQQRGLDVDHFAQGLSFFFNAHIDFFEEIAKYRAARRIWARWLRDQYGAKEEVSWRLRFHTQTAGCSLTAQQPENNIVRTAVEALAAVLGGTQSLHTNALDEVLALPTEKAAEIALRTQQIIAHETGAANVIDPLGGSYFVETLTNRMEEAAEEYFAKIKEMGRGSMLEGMLAGIERGYFQSEIADAAFREQELYEKGRLVKVGVNEFVDTQGGDLDILVIPPETEERQIAQVRRMRRGRDQERAEAALSDLERAAATDENLIPLLVECARAYCTEGEIVDSLRRPFGEYTEDPRF